MKNKKSNAKPEKTSEAIRIEGSMTVVRALELKPILIHPLQRSQDLDVDLSAISEIDTAGLQLLVLAKKTAIEKKQELRLVGHSPAVVEMFELLNLAAYFGDPLVIDAQKK
jgi:anti-sigma B factor antagonist